MPARRARATSLRTHEREDGTLAPPRRTPCRQQPVPEGHVPLQSIMTDGELTLEAFRKQLPAGSRSRRGRTIDIESMADLGRLELFVDERRNKAAGQRSAAAAPRKGSTRAKTNWAKFRALVWADLGLPTWGSGGSEGAANGASRRHDAPGRSKCTALGASQREDALTQPSTALVPAPEPKPKPRPKPQPTPKQTRPKPRTEPNRRPPLSGPPLVFLELELGLELGLELELRLELGLELDMGL